MENKGYKWIQDGKVNKYICSIDPIQENDQVVLYNLIMNNWTLKLNLNLICIEQYSWFKNINGNIVNMHFIIGDKYHITAQVGNNYEIEINGEICRAPKNCFATEAQIRENKLKEILKNDGATY